MNIFTPRATFDAQRANVREKVVDLQKKIMDSQKASIIDTVEEYSAEVVLSPANNKAG